MSTFRNDRNVLQVFIILFLTGEIAKKVLCGVLYSTFGTLGILGNVLSIIVFTRSGMRSNDSYMILCGMYVF